MLICSVLHLQLASEESKGTYQIPENKKGEQKKDGKERPKVHTFVVLAPKKGAVRKAPELPKNNEKSAAAEVAAGV